MNRQLSFIVAASLLSAAVAFGGGILPPMTITNGPVQQYYSPEIGNIYVQPMVIVSDGQTNPCCKAFCGFGEFTDLPVTNSTGEVIGWVTHEYNPVKFHQVNQTRQLRWSDDDPMKVRLPDGTWYQPVLFLNAIWVTNAP